MPPGTPISASSAVARALVPQAGSAGPMSPPRAVEIRFMTKTMLIDAAHAEETRVVVVDGNRVEDFDFESQNRKQDRKSVV